VEGARFTCAGAASSRISGAYDAEIARIDLGNHAFSEDFALRQTLACRRQQAPASGQARG
jgi:hypothetical protein